MHPLEKPAIDLIRAPLIGAISYEAAVEEIKNTAAKPGVDAGTTPVALLFRRYGTRRMCVKIARSAALKEVSPAALLWIEQERWIAEPFLWMPEFSQESHVTLAIADAWVNVLLMAVEEEFHRLPTPELQHAPTARMIREKGFEERIRQYRLKGPRAFTDVHTGRKWVIASRWDDWNRKLHPWEARHHAIENEGYPLGFRAFQDLCTRTLGLEYKAARAGVGGKRRSQSQQ